MKQRLISTSNSHIPSYVNVYNSLYSDIMNGVFLENEFLPSEVVLSEKYSVSRNTLRQALAILSEDGLIIKSQGKGTTVAKRTDKTITKKIFNPMVALSIDKIDLIKTNYNFNPPTDIARKKLGLSKSDIILASNNIYSVKETIVGFSFMQIPTQVIANLNLDPSIKDEVDQLLNHTIFELANKSIMNVKLIYANKMEIEILKIPEETPLLLAESILYDSIPIPIARCKFYFIPEYYKLQFQL